MEKRNGSVVRRAAASAALMVSVAGSGMAWHARAAGTAPAVGAVPGYRVSVFAQGTASYFQPDSIAVVGTHVFVAFKNNTSSTGVGTLPSTLVEYTMSGSVVRKIAVINQIDGLRYDAATGMLIALSDNDAKPRVTLINPNTGVAGTSMKLVSVHGGGYDDLAIENGKIYLSASTPSLTNGINTHPSVVQLTLTPRGPVVKPILMADAQGMNVITGQMTKMNIWDPEGMNVAPNGDVVQLSENGATLTFIHNIGTAKQTASILPESDQIDDLLFIPQARGTMFVVSDTQNVVYRVTSTFKVGTVYVAAGHGAPVSGFVGTMDLTTGYITPVIAGVDGATGFAFAPSM